MADDNLLKIRGWLLLYVVWAVFGIIFSIYSNGNGIIFYSRNLPMMLPASIVVFILVLLFYGFYAWLLYKLARKRQGIVSKIKLMIFVTPVFNALLPTIFSGVVIATNSDPNLGASIFKAAYSPAIIGSIAGGIVVATVWYTYFCVSRRVRAIWPNG